MAKKDIKTQELFNKAVPKMPDGFYSGDKPNPNLPGFVGKHLLEKPYDQEKDDYEVPAFDKPIEATKATAIYNMHSYHQGKKPHDAIREYIRHFTSTGDLVMDPFSGSGGTSLAALMENRKAIGIDRSPAATFITKSHCSLIDLPALCRAFDELKVKIQPDFDFLYRTKCDRCGGKATTSYTVYSQVFECPRCLNKVALYDCTDAESETAAGKPKSVRVCPHCLPKGHQEIIRSQSQKFGYIPVLVSYQCDSGCKPKRAERRRADTDTKKRESFENCDQLKIAEIDKAVLPYWFPNGFSLRNFSRYQRDALRLYGVHEVADLFTKRSLWMLASILHHIAALDCDPLLKDALRFALSGCLLGNSKMVRESNTATMPGTYCIAQISKEINTFESFEGRLNSLFEGWKMIQEQVMQARVCISTQSSADLSAIPSDSVDYIFTDPPYADKVQYGELNYVWEAWLGFETSWHAEEIIVNEVRQKTEEEWGTLMTKVMTECFRVLKPGRWLSLCYHDTSEGTWSLVQDIMAHCGFFHDPTGATLFIDTGQKSFNQHTADKTTKRDLVINFRKPKPGEERSAVQFTGAEDQQSFREKAQAVIREFLQTNPGSTMDRIYDQLVSRLVRRGEMEAHDFNELLRQVADEVKEEVKKNLFEKEEPDLLGTHQISRWHLKESEAGADETEQATTDSAGTRIHEFLTKTTAAKLAESEPKVTELQAEIAARRTRLQAVDQNEAAESRGRLVRDIRELNEKLDKLNAQRAEWEQQALDYSQIYEFYVVAVKPQPKARLEEILEDYGYQTDEGNWRPPLTEQEKLEKGSERQQAVRRKIQRFCKLLEAGDGIPADQRPDAQTLAEWIRHCRRTGSHAQGKLLYERGGDLSTLNEQAQADVEEDYQVCVKLLERGKK